MDTEEYDEFGNPIGDVSSGSEPESGSESENVSDSSMEREDDEIVVAEDSSRYLADSGVFGPDVETIVATTDTKEPDEPIVAPANEEMFKIEESELPETVYSKQYMCDLLRVPQKVRNVALCGSFHSGKTSFVDLLVQETHKEAGTRYTDNMKLEAERGLSIKASTITLLLQKLSGSSVVTNLIDCPGHTNFMDEVSVALRQVDSAILAVDVTEGVTESLEMTIDLCISMDLPMCLLLTKLDRLVLELRLPPVDAYYKVRDTIDKVNSVLRSRQVDSKSWFSPPRGNVCFESSIFGICFTLDSFATLYLSRSTKKNADPEAFSRKLWGDVYFINRKFTKKPENALAHATERTFIKFIFEPIYKIVTTVLTLEPSEMETFVRDKLHILTITHKEFKKGSQFLVKRIMGAFIGPCAPPFAEILQTQLPSPASNNKAELYGGKYTGDVAKYIRECNPEAPLVAYISRLVNTKDGSRFYAEVRILSGTLTQSSSVRVLGESYSGEFTEDSKLQTVKRAFVECGRYRIGTEGLPAGAIGLVSGPGIDSFITKSATIYDPSIPEEQLRAFKPLAWTLQPVFKVAIQPENPSDTAKFIEGLKQVQKAYIGCEIKVEEGGEHVVIGYGELYMDCLLHDLRKLYAKVELKVSDPLTRFAETCVDESKVKLDTTSGNGKNTISIIAEPLERDISEDLERGLIDTALSSRKLSKVFRQRYDWDILAARSIWAFGPTQSHSTSILCDDTLADEVDKEALTSVKESIVQGFHWAVREGPLCGEPIRDVRFRIIDAKISINGLEANSAQIIQMARKACHGALIISTPRLLEPVYGTEIFCRNQIAGQMRKFLERRRGSIGRRVPVPATPLSRVFGLVPVTDSFGLETDIRLMTKGAAICQLVFNKWQNVPGNPLDKTAYVPLLKAAPTESLARDFTMKTRKRKGLDAELNLAGYFDDGVWLKLQAANVL